MNNKTAGFTLIEMMVGLAIGLIIVAAATVMIVSTLKSQKDITASAKLNQELGATMAVMSNEIRRAGFSVCDIKMMHDATPPSVCPDNDGDSNEDPFILYNTSATNKDLEIFGVNGDCILYRYNADVDDTDDSKEHRGFRLNSNYIQMAGLAGDVRCDDPANSTKWKNLTNTDVINVTELSFSPIGSKCRNMTKSNPSNIAEYWVIGGVATEMACDNNNSDTVDYCIVTEDPSDPLKSITNCTSGNKVFTSGDDLIGTHQIRITLEATLTRGLAVTKRLESSVKVANPRIEIAP